MVRVLAAIVTHNRLLLLRRCLDALCQQQRAVDGILVVNNGSTDGTLNFLEEWGKCEVISQENKGSAGGWDAAIRYFLASDFDFIWLMDDDGFPDEGALRILERHIVPHWTFISSNVLVQDRPSHLVFPMPKITPNGIPRIWSIPRKISTADELARQSSGHVFGYASLFNGALISKDTVRLIGNIDTTYFMYGDELDYLYRALKLGPVQTVLKAHHFHPDVSKRPFLGDRPYYYLRNSIIIARKYLNYPYIRIVGVTIMCIYRIIDRNNFSDILAWLLSRDRKTLMSAILHGMRPFRAK